MEPVTAIPRELLAVLGALLGLVIGSFLNVVIYRLPRGESLAWPGSHCPACEMPIRWYDNIPINSNGSLRALRNLSDFAHRNRPGLQIGG